MESACVTLGLDLGDEYSAACAVHAMGKVLDEGRVCTMREGMEEMCGQWTDRRRVVMEAGTHSPLPSRLIGGHGHEVLVANPRKVRLIFQTNRKQDKVDAEALALLGRMDVTLLSPLRHPGARAQSDLAVVAVARKLELLLHRLWVSGEVYEPVGYGKRKQMAVCG